MADADEKVCSLVRVRVESLVAKLAMLAMYQKVLLDPRKRASSSLSVVSTVCSSAEIMPSALVPVPLVSCINNLNGRTDLITCVVYLAAVLEYLAAEILELAGNAARDNKKQRCVDPIYCHMVDTVTYRYRSRQYCTTAPSARHPKRRRIEQAPRGW